MKRILALLLGFSIFLTGCNSILSAGGLLEVESVAAEVPTEATKSSDYSLTAEELAEDYNQDRFAGLTGTAAFYMAEQDSKRSEDINYFQIVDITGSVITYVYETHLLDGAGKTTNQLVHAMYEYDFKRRSHKERYRSHAFTEEGWSAAHKLEHQIYAGKCDTGSGKSLFLYDGGRLRIYKGDEVIMDAGLESWITDHYGKGVYGISVTNAVTDGENRIYVELALEINQVETPDAGKAGEYDPDSRVTDEGSEDKAEDEKNICSVVLVYHIPDWTDQYLISNMIDFEAYAQAYVNKVEGKELTSIPNPQSDWLDIIKNCRWEDWHVALGGKGYSLYQWKAGEVFNTRNQNDHEVNTMIPSENSFLAQIPIGTTPQDHLAGVLQADGTRNLSGQFYLDEYGHYYRLTGSLGIPTTLKRGYTRHYTYVYTVTETDADGNTHERRVEEERSDYQKLWYARKATFQTGAYLEGFWLLKDSVTSASKGYGRRILVQDGSQMMLYQGNGSLQKVFTAPGEGEAVYAIRDGDRNWMMYTTKQLIYLLLLNENADGTMNADLQHIYIIDKSVLNFGHKNNEESAEDRKFMKQVEGKHVAADADDVYSNADVYTDESMMFGEKLDELIIATQHNGVVLLKLDDFRLKNILTEDHPGKGKEDSVVQISKMTCYRAFRVGSTSYAIGFAAGDHAYERTDIPYAIVYDVTKAMHNKVDVNAETEEESTSGIGSPSEAVSEEVSEAVSDASESSVSETTQSALEMWNASETYVEEGEEEPLNRFNQAETKGGQ